MERDLKDNYRTYWFLNKSGIFLKKGTINEGKRYLLRTFFQTSREFLKNGDKFKYRKKYYRACLERLNGRGYDEIGRKMGLSLTRVRTMILHCDYELYRLGVRNQSSVAAYEPLQARHAAFAIGGINAGYAPADISKFGYWRVP